MQPIFKLLLLENVSYSLRNHSRVTLFINWVYGFQKNFIAKYPFQSMLHSCNSPKIDTNYISQNRSSLTILYMNAVRKPLLNINAIDCSKDKP